MPDPSAAFPRKIAVSSEQKQRFLSLIRDWLCSLPHDVKVLFEAKDDPNLDRKARELATGAIVFLLNPESSSGPEFVEYADDVVLLRQVLRDVKALGGEFAGDFCGRFGEYYESLDEDLSLCETVMGGDVYAWIASKVPFLTNQIYKGKKVAQYLDRDEDSELLYDDGLAFQTEYPIDEEQLEMRLKKVETLLEPLRRKAIAQRQMAK